MKIEPARELGDNEELFNEIADELGTFHALELRLLRVRDSIIGIMSKGRNDFDPVLFQTAVWYKE